MVPFLPHGGGDCFPQRTLKAGPPSRSGFLFAIGNTGAAPALLRRRRRSARPLLCKLAPGPIVCVSGRGLFRTALKLRRSSIAYSCWLFSLHVVRKEFRGCADG